MTRELALFKMLAAILAIMLVVLLAVWAYRYVQYRRAVRLAQMRWLHFEASKVFTEAEAQQSLDWSSSASTSSSSSVMASLLLPNQQLPAHMLSPIPEERGRDSIDSLGSARRDQRLNAASFVSYGSMEAP